MSERNILIIGGDSFARRTLHGTLHAAGFAVTDLEYSEEAPALCRHMLFAVVLIATGGENEEVKMCRFLRPQIPRTAILVLSESDDPIRKFDALEAGADDYLAKPFHSEELVAQIRAIIFRSRALSHPATQVITIGEISLDVGRRLALKAGQPLHLTPKEFNLLYCLMRNAGTTVSHSSLLAEMWGPDRVHHVANLRVLMRQLRIKLGDDGDPRYLLTDGYVGYHFVEAAKRPG